MAWFFGVQSSVNFLKERNIHLCFSDELATFYWTNTLDIASIT
jgi:hypothetical protein